MALEMRDAIAALTETWRRLGHDIGFGIGIAHGFATLGTIGFEGRFDYAAIGTVSNVASRLCDEAKPGQILIGHDIGFGIGIAHGFATLGTIGFEGRFDYAAIGTVSNVASRLCDEAKPGQILISPRVLTKVEDAVKVEPVGEFELKGIRRPLAAYNVLAAVASA